MVKQIQKTNSLIPTQEAMTPEEYADKHERRLTTAHHALMKGFKDGQESFKSSLREEIEKRKNHQNQIGYPDYYKSGRNDAYNEFLKLLDTITPKQ